MLHKRRRQDSTEARITTRAASAAQRIEQALQRGQQVLVLVPEINLTPQLEARFAERFAGHRLVSLHSGLTPAQRLRHWLLAMPLSLLHAFRSSLLALPLFLQQVQPSIQQELLR